MKKAVIAMIAAMAATGCTIEHIIRESPHPAQRQDAGDSPAPKTKPEFGSDRRPGSSPTAVKNPSAVAGNNIADVAAAERQRNQLRQEISELEARIIAGRADVVAITAEADAARDRLDAVRREIKEEEERLHARQAERLREDESVQQRRAENDQLAAQVDARRADVDQLEKVVDERRDGVRKLEEQVAALVAEMKSREQALAELEIATEKIAGDAAENLAGLNRAAQATDQLLQTQKEKLETLSAADRHLGASIRAGQEVLANIDAQIKTRSDELGRLQRAAGEDNAAHHSWRSNRYVWATGAALLVGVIAAVAAIIRRRPRECRVVLGWRTGAESELQRACLRFNPRIQEISLTPSGPQVAPIGATSEGARLQVRRGRLRLIDDGQCQTATRSDEAVTLPLPLNIGDDVAIGTNPAGAIRIVLRDFDRVGESEQAEELNAALEATAAS